MYYIQSKRHADSPIAFIEVDRYKAVSHSFTQKLLGDKNLQSTEMTSKNISNI